MKSYCVVSECPLAEHDDAGILEQSENVLDCGLPPGRQEADVCGDLFGYRTAGGPFRAQASGNASSSST